MEFIHAPKACASVGPYSHCVKAGSTYYLCGQVPFHPVTGEVVGNGMKEQAVQTLANMKAVLEAAGLAVTDTSVGVSRALIIRISVDFPAPLNPMIP